MSQGYIRKLESFNLTCSIYLDVLFLLLLVTGIILISYLSRGRKLKKKKKEKKSCLLSDGIKISKRLLR